MYLGCSEDSMWWKELHLGTLSSVRISSQMQVTSWASVRTSPLDLHELSASSPSKSQALETWSSTERSFVCTVLSLHHPSGLYGYKVSVSPQIHTYLYFCLQLESGKSFATPDICKRSNCICSQNFPQWFQQANGLKNPASRHCICS